MEEKKLESHLKKCNSKPKIHGSYYNHNANINENNFKLLQNNQSRPFGCLDELIPELLLESVQAATKILQFEWQQEQSEQSIGFSTRHLLQRVLHFILNIESALLFVVGCTCKINYK